MRWLMLIVAIGAAHATVRVDGVEIAVVDPHLHTLEKVGDLNLTGKAFILRQLPAFVVPYYPALAARISDPYDQRIGIAAQLDWAGVDQGVLLATYTHHTVGFMTNTALGQILADPRNQYGDSVRFFGMASILLDGSLDPGVMSDRLQALKSHLEDPSAGFIGVKLAHAHQGVTMDDPWVDQVYELAAQTGVPVLLHTGFSPFPGTRSELEYISPADLEEAIRRHDGTGEMGRVEFVLSHIGSGDERAVLASLDLAERYDNVWLELSALSNGLMYDIEGTEIESDAPQYEWVLSEIRDRGLVGRTMFATDGPQSSGKVRDYLGKLIEVMQELGYTTDQISAVLGSNFYRCFARAG